MISKDCETTGLDRHHGARPFLVTSCNEEYENTFWQWDVDPYTRKVLYKTQDLEEIATSIEEADELVFHNCKFDIPMLMEILKLVGFTKWPWEKTHDTIISSHLLASNHFKDLTTVALEWLNIDIDKYDKECEWVVKKCRAFVRRKNSPVGNWRIAKEGLPEMPSAEEKTWKYDLWLPAALAQADIEWPWDDDELSRERCLECVPTYANTDSATTIAIRKEHARAIDGRKLEKIYASRMELLPSIVDMEERGITLHGGRLNESIEQYKEESDHLGAVCKGIARTYDYDLELPVNGVNNSLREFVFDKMALPAIKTSKKTGAPSMDKTAMEVYELTLPPRSKQLKFIESLKGKRQRDTAISYMESYKKFWLPYAFGKYKNWYILFPSLNMTGTDTLRCSSQWPNEQNISKKKGFNLRRNFGPPPGFEWWSMDAKNIELRLPAYESGETELIELFERPNDPPYYGSNHLLNFSTVYPDIWDKELRAVGELKVGPHCKEKYASSWYQRCKNGGFAVQYGAVEREDGEGTADKAFGVAGAHAMLKERFAKLEDLNRACIEQAEECGYVETMPDKTVDPERGYPLLCTLDDWGRIKPTVPLNYHVQGSAMWWMGKAMIRCQNQINEWRERGIQCRIVMQVHDELVFELPRGKTPTTNLPKARKLAYLMSKGGDDLGVPTPVSAELHLDNYSEGISML